MKRVSGLVWFGAVVMTLAGAGCGQQSDGFAYQPVSGVVTVNGAPVAGLTVSFAPQGASLDSGRPSVATTDAEGRYEAKTIDGVAGAAVGDHLVSITSETLDPETQQVVTPETIPPKYNRQTTLKLTVPAEGTDAANFELTTKKR